MSETMGGNEPLNSDMVVQRVIEEARAIAARRLGGATASPTMQPAPTPPASEAPSVRPVAAEISRGQVRDLGSRVVSLLSSYPERAPLVTLNDVSRQSRIIPLTDVVWRFSERVEEIARGWIMHPGGAHPRTPQEGLLPGAKYSGILLSTNNSLYEFTAARGRADDPYGLFVIDDSWNPAEMGGMFRASSYETINYHPDELQTALDGLVRHCNVPT